MLEKIFINRIMYHAYANNHNQFGFTPKKSKTDGAMTVKEFVEDGLREWLIAILVSLDVIGAFDTAWWPSILKNPKRFQLPEKFILRNQKLIQSKNCSNEHKHRSGRKRSLQRMSLRI